MKVVIDGIVEDYVQVLGIQRGVSKKDGPNKGRPYAMVYLAKALAIEGLTGYTVDNMFFFTDKDDPLKTYGVNVGDQICPIYVGTGDFKKLKSIEVIPFKSK